MKKPQWEKDFDKLAEKHGWAIDEKDKAIVKRFIQSMCESLLHSQLKRELEKNDEKWKRWFNKLDLP